MLNNVFSVANAFIELAKRDHVPISNMMLQKLLYFAQGHSLGLRGEPLVDEAPEAWTYGPVFPDVYHSFKSYGGGPIKFAHTYYDPNEGGYVLPPRVENEADRAMIEAVWNAYKNRSPVELSNMSHVKDGPWDKVYGTYRNADIRDSDMQAFFKAR